MEQNNSTINIRFKCALARESADETRTFSCAGTALDAKYELFRSWPLKWPRARSPADIRLIFLGREVKDDDLLSVIKEKSKVDPVTVHLTIRQRRNSTPVATPTVHYPTSPIGSPISPSSMPDGFPRDRDTGSCGAANVDGVAESHFHAVTVSERELAEFRMIFDRKKRASDGKIAFSVVRLVLKSYWEFIHREGFELGQDPFPEERLLQLGKKVGVDVDSEQSGLSLDQFLTVFYLFDNGASEEQCIHGGIDRVRIATAQLHGALQPTHDFYHDRFDEVFALVCSNVEDQALTCKEMELLYYMYSAFVLEKVREEELVSKVQAIIRMKIQSKEYTRMREAARTLQNCWRMRMFGASDILNHQRIAEFLQHMTLGELKPGQSRH